MDPEVKRTLSLLQSRVVKALGQNLIGLYLQGSLALGDFDEDSDIDFIALVKTPLTQQEVSELSKIHRALKQEDGHWFLHLEGSYFPEEVLMNPQRSGEKVWYVDRGSESLEFSNHCNTLVVRWTLFEKGITLTGPPIQELLEAVDSEALCREIASTMGEWALEVLEKPEHWKNHFYQCFLFQSYCRVLHSLTSKRVFSKRESVEWLSLEWPEFSGLAQRSWLGRKDPAKSVRSLPPSGDYQETLVFLQRVLQEMKSLGYLI